MIQKRFFYLLLFIFLIKCLLATFLPLVADEAYYYVWSLRPQLSYYDHPGMVSWLIYLGTHLIDPRNPLSIRIFFILFSTLTMYVWLLILNKNNFSAKLSLIFLLLIILNPLLGIGSILATPDVPFVFFWSLSYLFFLNLLEYKKIRWYFLLGAALGLGFCSKYIIVLFVASGIITLFYNKTYHLLTLKGILVTLISGFLFSLPVLVWNYQNEWISFLFQLNHGFGRSDYKFEWSYSYLAGQFLILSPLVFMQFFRKNNNSTNLIFSATPILFFATSTFKSVVEANWPIASYSHALANFVKTEDLRKIRITVIYWIVIYSVIGLLIASPFGISLIKNQPVSTDMIALRPIVQKYQPLYGPNYQISSLLSWDQQKLIPKLANLSRQDFFDHLPESTPNQKTIYVLKHLDSDWPKTTSNAQIKILDRFDNLELELYQVDYE
ncbi:MAG: glycosyltransferase family 39 protein [Pseudobdellovibrio sp.]